jgi:hypothetical protein
MVFIERKIPGVMLGHSDYTHHTSEDTPDKVDPVELERSELIAAATMLYLSDLTAEQAIDLVSLATANGARRIGSAARRANRLMSAAGTQWHDVENTVSRTVEWEREVVSSVLHFNEDQAARTAVAASQVQMAKQEEHLLDVLKARARGMGMSLAGRGITRDRRIPVRLTRGPLNSGLPESRLSGEDALWYRSSEFDLTGSERFELVNFVDGTRSVSSIRDALSAEFRPIPVEVVGHYLEDLVKVGVIGWKQ